MQVYDFALIATSNVEISINDDFDIADALFEAGAEDCTVASKGKTLIIEFDREATSYKDAVLSAIQEVKTVNSLTIKSVDAGQYVGLSDAAELSELTRSALSKFSKGDRGDGTFPSPYLRVNTKAPLYDWSEIAQWLEERGFVEKELAENAKFTSQVNMALKLKYGELETVSALVAEI